MFFNKKSVWGGLSVTVIQKNQILGNETKNIRGLLDLPVQYQFKGIKRIKLIAQIWMGLTSFAVENP